MGFYSIKGKDFSVPDFILKNEFEKADLFRLCPQYVILPPNCRARVI